MPHLEGRAKAMVALIPADGRMDLRLHKHLRSAERRTEQQRSVGGCSGFPCKGATAGRHTHSSFVSTLHKRVAVVSAKTMTKNNNLKNNATEDLLFVNIIAIVWKTKILKRNELV